MDAEALGAQLKEAQLEAKVAAGEAAKAEELAREMEKLRTENERLNRKASNLPPTEACAHRQARYGR